MAILDRLDQALSITDIIRSSKTIIDSLASGKQDKYVVMRNNIPAAVMLNVEVYEALIDMLCDHNLEQKAIVRATSATKEDYLTQETLLEMLEQKEKF